MESFVQCSCGSIHWGVFGAAGLLFRAPAEAEVTVDEEAAELLYLLVLRHPRSHQGGTWALPGGALMAEETALVGALRETLEELGPLPSSHAVTPEPTLTYVDDHGDWAYTTLVVDLPATFEPAVASWETAGWRWVTASEALAMPMLPALRAAWPVLSDRSPAAPTAAAPMLRSLPEPPPPAP